jgi:hypothetical protein
MGFPRALARIDLVYAAALACCLSGAIAEDAQRRPGDAAPITEIHVEPRSAKGADAPVVLEAESVARPAQRPAPRSSKPPPPPEVTEDTTPPRAVAAEKPTIPEGADVIVVQRGGTTIEEYRVKGRLVMSKVTPPHGVPYYLQYKASELPPSSDDRPDSELRVPMWQLRKF